MFDIEIKRMFSAAHQLRGYNGACQNLHGHNYSVIVTVRAEKLNEIGLSLDFKVLKQAVDEILEGYDHHNLSELPEFRTVNPSSELLAQTIYRKLCARFSDGSCRVMKVCIGESENSSVTYWE